MLNTCVVLIHNNTLPQTAAQTQELISLFGLEQIDHPSYNPNLAHVTFIFSCILKQFLPGQHKP